MVASPLWSATAAEVYEPLVRVTVPVGETPLSAPVTATVTANPSAVVRLSKDGLTFTVAACCWAESDTVADAPGAHTLSPGKLASTR